MTDPVKMIPTDIEQVTSTEPDGKGNYEDVVTTHYTSPSGVRSHVKLPKAVHTKENVANAIHHDMKQIEDVQSLQDQPLPPPTA